MSKRKKILSGIFTLVIGLSVALPMRASADWDDHHRGHHEWREWRGDRHDWHWDRDHDGDGYGHAWRWNRYEDHYRGTPYTYTPGYGYAYPRTYGYGYGYPRNGQGMINPRNPNLYWACNSEGHHCHWAPRY